MFPPRENFFKVVILTTNAYDKTKETISRFAAGVVNLFSQKLNGGLSATLESFGLTNSENISNPATSEVFPSQGSPQPPRVSSLPVVLRTNLPLRQTNLNKPKNRSKICKNKLWFCKSPKHQGLTLMAHPPLRKPNIKARP